MTLTIYITICKVLVPFYRGAVVFWWRKWSWYCIRPKFSSPFIEERLYLSLGASLHTIKEQVLVPFYRGAVVFDGRKCKSVLKNSSRPLLSRSGCISVNCQKISSTLEVLVPFYRGAVVFRRKNGTNNIKFKCSRPLLSRSGCILKTNLVY